MEMSSISQLYEEYNSVRKEGDGRSQLSYDHFENMTVFFPCLLVVASDGVVDEEEWVYVQYLSRFMADPFKSNMEQRAFMKLKQDYYRELEYLIENLTTWQQPFIDALSAYLEEVPDMKETVLDTLYLFAEASEGTSDDEEREIARLVALLNLE